MMSTPMRLAASLSVLAVLLFLSSTGAAHDASFGSAVVGGINRNLALAAAIPTASGVIAGVALAPDTGIVGRESSRRPARRGSRLIGAGMLAAGVLAVAAGIVAVELDGHPRDCFTTSAGTEACPYLYQTRNTGLALVFGGAPVLLMGAWTLFDATW